MLALIACGDRTTSPIADATTRYGVGRVDIGIDADPNMPRTLAETGLCLDAGCTQISPDVDRVHAAVRAVVRRRDEAALDLPAGGHEDRHDRHGLLGVPGRHEALEGVHARQHARRDAPRHARRLPAPTSTTGSTRRTCGTPTQDDAVWRRRSAPSTRTARSTTSRASSMCRQCHENLEPSARARVRRAPARLRQHDRRRASISPTSSPGQADRSADVAADAGAPYFPLPGDATNVQPALGYLHANCGHCHNPNSHRLHERQTPMELRLTVGTLGTLGDDAGRIRRRSTSRRRCPSAVRTDASSSRDARPVER